MGVYNFPGHRPGRRPESTLVREAISAKLLYNNTGAISILDGLLVVVMDSRALSWTSNGRDGLVAVLMDCGRS